MESELEALGVKPFWIWVRPGFKTHRAYRYMKEGEKVNSGFSMCGAPMPQDISFFWNRRGVPAKLEKVRDRKRVTCKRCLKMLWPGRA